MCAFSYPFIFIVTESPKVIIVQAKESGQSTAELKIVVQSIPLTGDKIDCTPYVKVISFYRGNERILFRLQLHITEYTE